MQGGGETWQLGLPHLLFPSRDIDLCPADLVTILIINININIIIILILIINIIMIKNSYTRLLFLSCDIDPCADPVTILIININMIKNSYILYFQVQSIV